jgi:hypothetical protein
MALTIYTSLDAVPASLRVIEVNDVFFNGGTKLMNTPETAMILERVDKAKRVSDTTFIGRDVNLGALYKKNLSTGAKTLLNITQYADKDGFCFSTRECGINALVLLIELSSHVNSSVFWEFPCIPYDGPDACEIVYDGVLYTSYEKFFNTLYYEDREVDDIDD